MKNFWKENKVLIVLAIIIIVAVIAMAIGLFTYFYSKDTTVYGNRLNNIEKYPLDKELDQKIKALYESGVESVKIDIKGKIVNVIIDLSKESNKDQAREYASRALGVFTEDELNFYDIQFMMTCSNEENEEKIFPIIGYKNSSSQSIVWTNN